VVYCLLACVCSMTRPDFIRGLKLELLSQPPHISHVAPSNFHISWPSADALCGCHFTLEEDVKVAKHDWLTQQPREFTRKIMNSWKFDGAVWSVVGTTLKIDVMYCI
jgi:hypothetical protein